MRERVYVYYSIGRSKTTRAVVLGQTFGWYVSSASDLQQCKKMHGTILPLLFRAHERKVG